MAVTYGCGRRAARPPPTVRMPAFYLLLTAPAERAPARARIDYSWCADASP